MNYAGKAESCSYEEIIQKEYAPEGFHQVTVTFEKDDEVLKTMQVPYGGTVVLEDAPEAEPDEDSYLKWDQVFPVTHVNANLTITAENKRWTKSLAYLAKDAGKADFLVEGDFYDSSALLAKATEAPARNGEAPDYAYEWGMDHLPEKEVSIRFISECRMERTAQRLWCAVTDSGKRLRQVRDGSYVTAIIPAEAVFAVYAEYEPEFPWYLGAGAIVVVGAAGFVIVFLVRKKKKQKKSIQ